MSNEDIIDDFSELTNNDIIASHTTQSRNGHKKLDSSLGDKTALL